MPRINEIATQDDDGNWICRICDKDLGPGPHAVALAHWNNYHNERNKGGRGFRKTAPADECGHEWRLLKPGDADGRGQVALDHGRREWCPKCGKLR